MTNQPKTFKFTDQHGEDVFVNATTLHQAWNKLAVYFGVPREDVKKLCKQVEHIETPEDMDFTTEAIQ